MVTENDNHHGDCPKDNEKNEQEHRDVARVVRAGDWSWPFVCPGDNPGDDDDHDHDDGDDVGPAVLWMRVCPKIVKLKFAKSHHKHLVLIVKHIW